MQIVQTKFTKARPIQEAQGKEFRVFSDRKSLHRGNVPVWFVYLHEYAWEAFLNHTMEIYSRTGHEGQGIFVGKYFQDEFGEFAVATSYFGGEGESSHSHVEMSEQCLALISTQCIAEDLLMLIWVHTHPKFGAFYSSTDINCLRTNFYMPFQIGMVVDIVSRDLKGFRVRDGEVIGFSDFALYNGEPARLVQPYENDGLPALRAQSLEIRRKGQETALAPTDELLREVKAINASLPTISDLLEGLLVRERRGTQEQEVMNDGLLAEEVTRLRKDVEFLKELIRKGEPAEIEQNVLASLTAPLERIEAGVKSLGLLSDKTETLTEAAQSYAKELSRQAKLQVATLALAALIFLLLLIKVVLRP
jgi:proteasome lid subunit RPN8/RPN11